MCIVCVVSAHADTKTFVSMSCGVRYVYALSMHDGIRSCYIWLLKLFALHGALEEWEKPTQISKLTFNVAY